MKRILMSTASAMTLSLLVLGATMPMTQAHAQSATYEPVTNAQINEFVRANLNNPAAIANAMRQYGVNLDRLQQATGYNRLEITNYINDSGNADLLQHLSTWTTASPQTMAAYNSLPAHMKGGISNPNGVPIVIIRDPSEIDTLPGLTAAQKLSYKAQFTTMLANPTSSIMGIGGYEYKITGTEDPLRAYPAGTGPVAAAPTTPAAPPAAPVTPATPQVTNAQINEYIRANLNDPAKIAAAMKQYNVNLDRIREATGYTRAEMTDYINNSGNAELKSYLANWTTASPATMADYNKLPAHMKGGISNPNGTPVVIIRDINEIDLLPGLTAAQKLSYKERFAALLANPTNSVMGIGGYEYKIAGTEDPLRAYPAGASAPTPPVASAPAAPVAPSVPAPIAQNPIAPIAPVVPPIITCADPSTSKVVPMRSSLKKFKGGYTLDNNGVVKTAKGDLAGILTLSGEFVDGKGNALSEKHQAELKALVSSAAETTKAPSKLAQGGVKYKVENNRLKLSSEHKKKAKACNEDGGTERCPPLAD